MIRIAITPEEIFPNEPQIITSLLSHGWDKVHLRHPNAALNDMVRLIEDIPQHFHRKLRLHGHFSLCYRFNLGGLHLNSRCPLPPDGYTGPYSKSCHSVDEVTACKDCDYITLSPIFDSISKPGYLSEFSIEELKTINRMTPVPIIALGGITPERIPYIRESGFSGYAVLGALMNHINDTKLFNRLITEFN
ncbi:MAG: thiamine phosphate synthase [Paramuribaculum sp.]|nr:thiamine phosphate synthase [Paramuribaculum sp.]